MAEAMDALLKARNNAAGDTGIKIGLHGLLLEKRLRMQPD
jgi:hypothetical protein